MQDTAVNSTEQKVSVSSDYQNKLDIALIKKDIENIQEASQQSEVSICKLEKVTIELSKNFSLQEQRLETQEQLVRNVERAFEVQRADHNANIQELNEKITKTNVDLTSRINQTEHTILNEIHGLKDDLAKRITDIDMYRYMVMGAIALAVFLVSNAVNLPKLLKLF